MAYSETISATTFNTRKVIDRAFGRCKLQPQRITGEMVDRAMDDLYLFLSSLPNRGTPLWCIQKVLLPISEAKAALLTPTGTIDVVNAFYRTLNFVTGTEVNDPAGFSTSLTTATVITTVGLQWSGASVPVTIQHSADGITWVTITTDDQTAVAGQTTWIDIDGATAKAYWRVLPTTGVLSLTAAKFGNNPTEILMARLNRDQYQQMPNKTFTGRPLQYWFDRQLPNATMHLWPTPDAAAAANMVVVYRSRHVMDVGTMTQELEVPHRWLNAVISGLAAMLAVDTPEVSAELIPTLQSLADRAAAEAWGEERDNSPVIFAPQIGVYTQ